MFRSFTSKQVPGNYIEAIKPGPDGRVRFLSEDDDRLGKTWYTLAGDVFTPVEKMPKPNDGIELTGPDGTQWRLDPDGVIRSIVQGPLSEEGASQRIAAILPEASSPDSSTAPSAP